MDKHFKVLDKKQTSLQHQDWTPVIIRTKNNESTKGEHSSKNLSEGQQRETKLLKKADNDELKHDKITKELRILIQQGRGKQKWTQKDLANKCNLPISVINEIETGKAIYNPQHINKIKRVLKI